jgi:hypothetical protein
MILSAHQRLALSRAGFDVELSPRFLIVRHRKNAVCHGAMGWGPIDGKGQPGGWLRVLDAMRKAGIDPEEIR